MIQGHTVAAPKLCQAMSYCRGLHLPWDYSDFSTFSYSFNIDLREASLLIQWIGLGENLQENSIFNAPSKLLKVERITTLQQPSRFIKFHQGWRIFG